MKTDKELFKLFSVYPELLFEAANLKPKDKYDMTSVTFKEFERRSDGLLEPKSNNEPVYMVEFQSYWDLTIYHRLVMEMAAYGKENPERDIRGILVFTNKNLDKKTLPWHELTNSKKNLFKVIYLEDFLDQLEKKDPNHPLVATFKPYREKNKILLRKNAKKWYQNIHNSFLPTEAKDGFEAVFTRWMQERFVNLSYKEITEMFVELTPLEQTRSYKELVSIGEKRGEKRGEERGKKKAYGKMLSSTMADKFSTSVHRIAPRLRPLRTKDLEDMWKEIRSMNSLDDAISWISERKNLIKT